MPKGSIGTGTNIVRRSRPSGPQLRLPKQPKRAEFFTRKQINAEVDRLRSERKFVLADDMQRTVSWEQALENWNRACDAARATHKEKLTAWNAKNRAMKAERAQKWQETIDFCKANGLPSPRQY